MEGAFETPKEVRDCIFVYLSDAMPVRLTLHGDGREILETMPRKLYL
jgi:hypothetical protein